MSLSKKKVTWLLVAVCFSMLIGGVIGYVYCAPEWQWQVLSAEIALAGVLLAVALRWRRRLLWEAMRTPSSYALGAFIMAVGFSVLVPTPLILFYPFLIVLMGVMCIVVGRRNRQAWRTYPFIMGSTMMMVGVFYCILVPHVRDTSGADVIPEGFIEFWLTLFFSGVAMLGALLILVSICWPTQASETER